MRIACLLMAAGNSSRFGGPKLLARLDRKPLLQLALEKLAPVFGADLFTVIGAFRDEIRPIAQGYSQTIEHTGWQQGLGTSIAAGIVKIEAEGNYDAVLIALADQVKLQERDYRTLVDSFEGNQIVASLYARKSGVPAIFPALYFSKLKQLREDSGAQKLLTDSKITVQTVPLPQARFDIDTRNDLDQYNR